MKERKRIGALHARLGGGEGEFKSGRSLLLTALTKSSEHSWSDLTQAIADGHLISKDSADNIVSSESIYDILSPDDAAVILALHEQIGGDDVAQALESWKEITVVLNSVNRSWIDLTNLLVNGMEISEVWKPNLLDELVVLLEQYVSFVRQPHDAVAAALWIIHTYVYDQFQHTPRLGAFSYDPQSGKSVLVTYLMGALVRQPNKLIADKNIAASLYWIIDAERPTILLDEAQNTEVVGTIKSIINGGFEKAMGGIPRRQGLGGAAKKYNLFAPFAFCWNKGSATSTLALDTLSRCIVLDFEKSPRKKRYNLDDPEQQERFHKMQERIVSWVLSTTFDTDPDIPSQIDYGRYADCWRPLLSIADAAQRGDMARKTAIAMSSRRMDESARIRLLRDIRTIFYNLKIRTIASDELLKHLHALEECSLEDGEVWEFWKGETRNRNPHALTKREMFAMLHTFKINTKTVRVAGQDKPDRGYTRDQFVPFWEKYCSDDGTSASQDAPKQLTA